jgi:IS5 family transposase
MYRSELDQLELENFYLPFGGKLSGNNRWVKLAGFVPWEEVERCYRRGLSGSSLGAPAKAARIAFGALIIKERLGVTDEETVEQISENPYLQYFLGLREYRDSPLFNPSMMVHFRSRFEQADFTRINEAIIESVQAQAKKADDADSDPGDRDGGITHQGKLVLDATCTPADITYPTDLKLLNEGREKLEKIIDILHAPFVGLYKKPRTYRRKARKAYLKTAKKKKVGAKPLRVAIGKQLRFIRRDLGHIDSLLERGSSLTLLTGYEYRWLLVIHTLYVQQLEMYEGRTHQVADRIVSISQPQVRPMVRGKPASKTEFGAKISVSHVHEGYVLLDQLSWDAFNESGSFIEQVEKYRKRFGCYPVSVHADEIYRTRANRRYCQQKGIRLSGKPLGRPRKVTAQNQAELKAAREQVRRDELDRIPIEGKFGNAKRKGSLARVMAKLPHTSLSVINIGLIVLNLDKWLREQLCWLIKPWDRCRFWLEKASP